jgi:hypothetical protein
MLHAQTLHHNTLRHVHEHQATTPCFGHSKYDFRLRQGSTGPHGVLHNPEGFVDSSSLEPFPSLSQHQRFSSFGQDWAGRLGACFRSSHAYLSLIIQERGRLEDNMQVPQH